MQIRFTTQVKLIYYKSSKFGGWVGKVGGGPRRTYSPNFSKTCFSPCRFPLPVPFWQTDKQTK